MNFRQATDRATSLCITLADIAEATGVSDNKVRRARMDPGSPEHRSAPEGWEPGLVKLLRERAKALTALADRLEK